MARLAGRFRRRFGLCRTRSRCWRRKGTENRGNRGLVESGLHEDHAELGGNFEDEFAVALGAAVIVEGNELVDDGASAAGEAFGAGAEGLGMRSVVLLARLTDELVDGFEDLGCVLGDEANGFAIDEEAVFTDRKSTRLN